MISEIKISVISNQLLKSENLQMKTKTGKFLMSHKKQKPMQNLENQDPKIIEPSQITPIKVGSTINLVDDDIKNKYGQQKSQQMTKYQIQLARLKDENRQLVQQIKELRNECLQLKQNVKILTNNSQNKNQMPQQVNQPQKQLLDSMKKTIEKNSQVMKDSSKQQLKVNSLQLQNYRLIEHNYILLLNLRRNVKVHKDLLFDLANKLENLEYPEAAKTIYDALSKMKIEEGQAEGLQKQFFPYKKVDKSFFTSKQTKNQSTSTSKNLRIVSSIYNFKHIIQQQLSKKQNQIQVKLNQIESFMEHNRYPKQSSSFHFINNKYRGSDSQFNLTKKLFNSQIRQNNFQNSGFDQVSINQNIQNDWDYGQKKSKSVSIYKCVGNSTELYKLLLLQASTIQKFIQN